MKRTMRWMLAGTLAMSLAGCMYYPDHGYVRGDGYGSTGGVYYDTVTYDAGYYGGYYGGGYYGGYGGYYAPYGYSPYYGTGYYSIGIGVYDGHRGGHGGGRDWNHHHGGRGHDARPAHRAGPEVQSRRRR
jgi:hypothetical protein